jgi:ArsR family transcriptional regulator
MDARRLETKAGQAATLLKALSNRRRLSILCRLAEGETSVGALAESLGLSQSALSQHLARLRARGLVQTRRDAQTIYYAVAGEEAPRIMAALAEIYCPPEPAGPRRASRANAARRAASNKTDH